ncbi:Sushi, von Willebrand factor type A, EGF and pentraxin, partial [Branchiostoma belcheri]
RRCPDNYTETFNGKCYRFSTVRETFNSAQEICGYDGGRLATIEESETNDFILQKIRDELALDSVWIGLNDRQEEGNYVWSDGMEASTGYTDWYPHQPDNYRGPGEDCVEIRPSGWNDRNCAEKLRFVCERAYAEWKPGEPNNVLEPHGEDCVHIARHMGYKWNDMRCDVKAHFVCEKEEVVNLEDTVAQLEQELQEKDKTIQQLSQEGQYKEQELRNLTEVNQQLLQQLELKEEEIQEKSSIIDQCSSQVQEMEALQASLQTQLHELAETRQHLLEELREMAATHEGLLEELHHKAELINQQNQQLLELQPVVQQLEQKERELEDMLIELERAQAYLHTNEQLSQQLQQQEEDLLNKTEIIRELAWHLVELLHDTQAIDLQAERQWEEQTLDIGLQDQPTTTDQSTPQLIQGTCGGRYDTAPGTIQSPGYPGNYPDNADCSYIITAPPGHAINITFQHFDLEQGYDFLLLSEEGGHREEYTGFESEKQYVSITNEVQLHFTSDENTNEKGFSLSYIFSRTCGGRYETAPGTIQSPGYPGNYPDNADCSYIITAPPGHAINITFQHFDLEQGYDLLVLSEEGRGRREEYTGLEPVTQYVSITNEVQLHFTSDVSANEKGFSLSYIFSRTCGGRYDTAPGTIQSPGYPGNYPDDADCSYIITAPPGHAINITLQHFDLETGYDTLVLREEGRQQEYTGLEPVTQYVSITNEVQLHFTSDVDTNEEGFSLSYIFSTTCEGLNLDTSTITSPGYPNAYPNNANCIYTIKAPPAQDGSPASRRRSQKKPAENNSSTPFNALTDSDELNKDIFNKDDIHAVTKWAGSDLCLGRRDATLSSSLSTCWPRIVGTSGGKLCRSFHAGEEAAIIAGRPGLAATSGPPDDVSPCGSAWPSFFPRTIREWNKLEPAVDTTATTATSTCGGLNETNHIITSPDYPAQYPDNAKCNYTIKAPPVPPACPEGFISHLQKCYWISDMEASYSEAEELCDGIGAKLAVIKDADTQEFITNSIKSSWQNPSAIDVGYMSMYWIGLHQERDMEGNFIWSDGSPLLENTGLEEVVSAAAPTTAVTSTCEDIVLSFIHDHLDYEYPTSVIMAMLERCEQLQSETMASAHRPTTPGRADPIQEETSTIPPTTTNTNICDGLVVLARQNVLSRTVISQMLEYCPQLQSEDVATTHRSTIPACPEGFISHQQKCYWISDMPVDYSGAEQLCDSLGGKLATIKEAGTQEFLADYIRDNMEPHQLRTYEADGYWIGLKDRDDNGNFVWSDGSPLLENCVHMFARFQLRWNDQSCGTRMGCICETVNTAQVTTPRPTTVTTPTVETKCEDLVAYAAQTLQSPTVISSMLEDCLQLQSEEERTLICPEFYSLYNQACYKASTNSVTYQVAEEVCEDDMASLAMIKDHGTQRFLENITNRREYWIGLSDRNSEDFIWSDGSPLSGFSSWRPEEPNHYTDHGWWVFSNREEEDCVSMSPLWQDKSCNDEHPYICQKAADIQVRKKVKKPDLDTLLSIIQQQEDKLVTQQETMQELTLTINQTEQELDTAHHDLAVQNQLVQQLVSNISTQREDFLDVIAGGQMEKEEIAAQCSNTIANLTSILELLSLPDTTTTQPKPTGSPTKDTVQLACSPGYLKFGAKCYKLGRRAYSQCQGDGGELLTWKDGHGSLGELVDRLQTQNELEAVQSQTTERIPTASMTKTPTTPKMPTTVQTTETPPKPQPTEKLPTTKGTEQLSCTGGFLLFEGMCYKPVDHALPNQEAKSFCQREEARLMEASDDPEWGHAMHRAIQQFPDISLPQDMWVAHVDNDGSSPYNPAGSYMTDDKVCWLRFIYKPHSEPWSCDSLHHFICEKDPVVSGSQTEPKQTTPGKPECPAHSSWTDCGSACPASCDMLGSDVICTAVCIPGCQCDDGYVRDGLMNCVPKEQCYNSGCNHNGNHYDEGATWADQVSPGHNCECLQSEALCLVVDCKPGYQHVIGPEGSWTCQQINLQCTSGYQLFRDVCYKVFDTTLDYQESEAVCREDGGMLAMPRDQAIDNFLIQLRSSVNPDVRYWIGLTDRRMEGVWTWADGQQLGAYSSWAPGEPNSAGDEDCALYAAHPDSKDKWNDVACFYPYRFICQKPAMVAPVVAEKTTMKTPVQQPVSSPNCPTSYSEFMGRCYSLSTVLATEGRAEHICAEQGAQLVVHDQDPYWPEFLMAELNALNGAATNTFQYWTNEPDNLSQLDLIRHTLKFGSPANACWVRDLFQRTPVAVNCSAPHNFICEQDMNTAIEAGEQELTSIVGYPSPEVAPYDTMKEPGLDTGDPSLADLMESNDNTEDPALLEDPKQEADQDTGDSMMSLMDKIKYSIA